MTVTVPADVERAPRLDVERVRADFPILTREVNGSPLVYLDSAATSQKPTPVLDRLDAFYRLHNANVHRGVHVLAEEATEAYESARRTLAAFLNVADPAEVVFTKGSTEAINLVAYALSNAAAARPGSPYSEYSVGPGDEICITEMEHHSNIVPWQLLCERTGATLRWLPITDAGRLDLTDLDTLVNERTRLLAFVHQSNILGTVNSVSPLVERARTVGALTLLDASQSVPHRGIDVQALGVDLAVLTGHKMCGPTGVGALWGRREVLEALPPVQGGGEMITTVSMAGSTYAPLPHKFEAGTPPIAQAVGLAAACDYLSGIGMDAIREHERDLTSYTLDRLAEVAGVRVIGPSTSISRGGAVSFTLDGIHPHDVGQLLDARGIAVRVGHHCAKPVCDRFGVAAVTRASSYLYTTRGEINALVDGIEHVRRFFA
ncbi:MAG: cysteine desulfurase [Actinomycetota bacterium]|nr:cysteine desulfurase [Actinomycetota bacterium]